MKTCTKCKETKPATKFVKRVRARDGLESSCKACAALVTAAWRLANPDAGNKWKEANPEKVKAHSAAWRAANPSKIKESNAAWRAANVEKLRGSKAKWYASNVKKRMADNAAWYAANTARAKTNRARWFAENPGARRVHRQNRRARNAGSLSAGLAERLFKLQRGKCACGCKQPLGDDYHLDHRMPLALGGSNTDDNMQLLRAICNLHKNAKHPIDFMQQKGFLL